MRNHEKLFCLHRFRRTCATVVGRFSNGDQQWGMGNQCMGESSTPKLEWKLPKYSNLFDTSTPAVQRFWPENSSLRESQFLLQTQTNQCSIATHQAFCSSTTMKNRHQLVTAICPDLAWAFPTAWGTIPQFECERVTNAAVRRATACRIPPEWLHTLFEPHGCTKFLAKR